MGKYVKIPSNFFDYEVVKAMEDSTVLLYLCMLTESYKKQPHGILKIADMDLTDEVISTWFCFDGIENKLEILASYGLIIREQKQIRIIKFWLGNRDRSSAEYRSWRMDVFKRDNFKCTSCGTKNDIQAHHIKQWKDNKNERYNVSNGITLCRKCHLKAHGGRWN